MLPSGAKGYCGPCPKLRKAQSGYVCALATPVVRLDVDNAFNPWRHEACKVQPHEDLKHCGSCSMLTSSRCALYAADLTMPRPDGPGPLLGPWRATECASGNQYLPVGKFVVPSLPYGPKALQSTRVPLPMPVISKPRAPRVSVSKVSRPEAALVSPPPVLEPNSVVHLALDLEDP